MLPFPKGLAMVACQKNSMDLTPMLTENLEAFHQRMHEANFHNRYSLNIYSRAFHVGHEYVFFHLLNV